MFEVFQSRIVRIGRRGMCVRLDSTGNPPDSLRQRVKNDEQASKDISDKGPRHTSPLSFLCGIFPVQRCKTQRRNGDELESSDHLYDQSPGFPGDLTCSRRRRKFNGATTRSLPWPQGNWNLRRDRQLRSRTLFPEHQATDTPVAVDAQPVSWFDLFSR